MAITSYNIAPYFDDYNVKDSSGRSAGDKNYLRILFQPGFAVQTREMNQMQSILQGQIDRLGSSFYRDGEAVLDGEASFRDNILYVEADIPTDKTFNVLSSDILLQPTIEIRTTGVTGGQYAKVLGIDAIANNKVRIYLQPIVDIVDSPGAPLEDVIPSGSSIHYKNDIQTVSAAGATTTNTNSIVTTSSTGRAFALSVLEGIYYVKGSFVHTPAMTRFWIKPSANYIVRGDGCLTITENIVTSNQDPTLLDNASGSYNYAAPGADRYSISLDIGFFEEANDAGGYTLKDDTAGQTSNIFAKGSTQTFSIARLFSVDESTIEVIENREQSNLEKRLARRTFEESGNYTVNPFKIAFREFAAKARIGATESNFYDERVDPVYYGNELNELKPFGITNVKDSEKRFIIQVEPSTAYVNGFRYEFQDKTLISVPKGRPQNTLFPTYHTGSKTGESFTFPVGNYFEITVPDSPTYFSLAPLSGKGRSGSYDDTPVRTTNTINAGYLNAQDSPGPTAQGGLGLEASVGGNAAVVKSLQYVRDTGTRGTSDSPRATYRVYVNNRATFLDIKQAFPNFYGRQIDGAGTTSTNLITGLGTNQASNTLTLNNLSNNALLFPLPNEGIRYVSKLSYSKYKKFGPTTISGSANGGKITVSGQSVAAIQLDVTGNESFEGISSTDKFDYTVIRRVTLTDGTVADRIINPENYTIHDGATSSSVTLRAVVGQDSPLFFNSPNSGDQFIVQAPVKVDAGPSSMRTKTKTQGTTTVTSQSYGAGAIFTLDDCDVIMSTLNGAGGNLKGKFEVIDDGQSDPEFYTKPVIKLTTGVDFTGVNTITYDYYAHGNGDFFSVNSYGDYTQNSPSLSYDEIGFFQDTQKLSDYIDFRVKETYTDDRGGNNFGPVALVPNRPAKADYQYYLSRKDRIVINGDGEITAVLGEPAIDPVLPPEPANSMTLYTYFVPGWTSVAKDITANYINNQRSTMKDLGRLKKRVEKVEYDSALSALENSAFQKNLLNEDGSQRFKNGILVDNFKRDVTANPRDGGYLASTDRTKGELRPYYTSNQFRLFYQFPEGLLSNQSSASNYSELSQDTLNDFYVNSTPNRYGFDINDLISIPTSGRPGTLSVTGFTVSGNSNTETNGIYQLYKPNTNGYPEYRKTSTTVALSKSTRRIVRLADPARWEIQTLKSDGTGYETEYFTDEDGAAGNSAAFPTKITVNWFNVSNESQNDSVIKSLLDDRLGGFLPESSTAEKRDRFLVDGANNGDVLSLWNGNKEVLFDQPNASRTVSVQPYELTRFEGNLKLSPDGDEWVDTTRLPASVVQDNTLFQVIEFFQNNTNLLDDQLGMFWNHWETLSQGTEVLSDVTTRSGNTFTNTTITETTREQQKTGIERTLEVGDVIEESQGDKVVDINIVPFIRSRDISIYANGLKPSTRIYAFFDGKDVSRYVAATETFRKYGFHENVSTYNGQAAPTSLTSGGPFQSELQNAYEAPLYTTAETGEFFGTFRIPNNDDMRFRTGNRKFKLTSSKTNKDADADTIASATYSAYGLNKTIEETIISQKIPTIVETQHTEQRTIVTQNTQVRQWRRDPIAQTFTIPKKYPHGVCVTDVDVFFAEKPDFPANVEVYIVPTEQGLPTNVVVPGSRVSLPSSQVKVPPNGRDETDGSAISSRPTNFKFDYPVHLKSGAEYALVVFSPSPLFRVWTAELGGANIINSQRPITKNSNIGVLLKSQNQSTWTADQTKDLMFRMNKGLFKTGRTGSDAVAYEFHTTASGANGNDKQKIGVDQGAGTRNVTISAFNIASKVLELPGTDVRFEVKFFNNSGELTKSTYGIPTTCVAEKTYELKKEIDTVGLGITNVVVVATLRSRDRGDGFADITPMIDLNKHSLLTFENHIETGARAATVAGTYNSITTARNELRGYVSKNVKLTNPANNLRIFLATNRVSEDGNLEVYTKARQIGDDCPWDNKNWEPTTLKSVIGGDQILSSGSTYSPSLTINANRETFTDSEYNFSPSNEITEYAIKIAFTGSGDSAAIVRCRDLRVIATS